MVEYFDDLEVSHDCWSVDLARARHHRLAVGAIRVNTVDVKEAAIQSFEVVSKYVWPIALLICGWLSNTVIDHESRISRSEVRHESTERHMAQRIDAAERSMTDRNDTGNSRAERIESKLDKLIEVLSNR